MGQASNSKRHAALDDRKERAAGRRGDREMIKEAVRPRTKATAGAFGREGHPNSGKPVRRRKV